MVGAQKLAQAQESTGALVGLSPDDLTPQEQLESVLEDADGDIGRQGPLGAAAEVGHVDGDPASGLEGANCGATSFGGGSVTASA